ncbi:5-dehydro-4-deoxy-D-glucuronate isomerase [Paenibacillus lignilyticus]|uniref:4-deoxy-L-threo-5-hexosulose-uronate ketol-isomerase n=1 Tax=Paenibacillus lignilyticus TaxID=1172615 RepID=A0ABS5C7N2_9BACL|nr:5-dehydro-4-deoxy-D-glucuronate isomerase [Paenibacillus lignilyticus]MBP3961954.1 5-dehydro-4-deoxy-D-glucuronate isomerase [Paenibacillus lignilyticus]
MEIRYASHPNEVKAFDTTRLREEFLIEQLFVADELKLSYSHVDRFIIGGAVPVNGSVSLAVDPATIGAATFLERREVGIINVGGKGTVTVDGEVYSMDSKDCLYIGRGAKDVSFASEDGSRPAKYYLNSAPAHQTYPTVKAAISEASPNHLGSMENSNERTIYRYIHTGGIQSCQLVMGMTLLKPGSMWNTMPCHTHNRRSEVYFYFDMPENGAVFHLMGEAAETRHLVVRNEQAVISPSWSIHSGVGTNSYTFIWGMAGENQTFEDMDAVAMKDLK